MRHLPFCRPGLIRDALALDYRLPWRLSRRIIRRHHACGRHVNYFFFAVFFEAFFFFEALAAFRFLAMSVTSFLEINTTR